MLGEVGIKLKQQDFKNISFFLWPISVIINSELHPFVLLYFRIRHISDKFSSFLSREHHGIEMFSTLLALCKGNPPKGPVSFIVSLSMLLNKHSICGWFDNPRYPCNVTAMLTFSPTNSRRHCAHYDVIVMNLEHDNLHSNTRLYSKTRNNRTLYTWKFNTLWHISRWGVAICKKCHYVVYTMRVWEYIKCTFAYGPTVVKLLSLALNRHQVAK